MPKKVNKRIRSPQKKLDVSASDSETEYQRPAKHLKTYRDSSKFRSTPVANYSPLYDGPSTSYAMKQNGNEASNNSYTNFSSFLQSHSFISEDEDQSLTVSQLFEKRASTLNRSDNSRKFIVNLSDSFRSSSRGIPLDDVRVYTVPLKLTEIVSLQHPADLTLHGYLKVTVLAGTVSILGYDVKEDESVRVFSAEVTGYKKIITKLSVHQITIDALELKLKHIVESDKNDVIEDFLENVGPSSVVVVLEKSLLPPPLQFLELYFPNAVKVDMPKKEREGVTMCSRVEKGCIEISPDAELIASQLSLPVEGGRVIVHGPKKSGKSSLLRYLIHTVLNTRQEVFYLDTDPGQTEFTPPGVVSLTKVTKPLLGPPYTHQREPVKMIFTGSITPQTSPPMYLKCVHALIEYFKSNHHKGMLFVNTMGWIEGIGDMCFQEIKAALNPTMLIDFLSREECPELKIEVTQDKSTCIQIPTIVYSSPKNSIPPKQMRHFSLMSYLGKCQMYFEQPTYINEFRPVCVNWDNIAIFVLGRKVEPYRLIEAIQCSVVALCHVDETLMLESSNPEYPKTLQDESINECVGFGFVRASDETNHLLYIVTPLSVEKLRNVNSLIKGNILIPDEVFLNQPILNTPLPYTDVSNTAPTSTRKAVKKRQFYLQQTPKNR